MRKVIASLDVGSTYIKLVVGEIYKNKLNILACSETPARGIKCGYIVNAESAIESLKEAFIKVQESIGIEIKKVVVTIPAFNTNCFYTEGSTSITSDEKIIKHKDLIRAMQASVYNKINDNYELISILPTGFVINDIDKVASPIGINGEKLTVKAIGVVVPKKNTIPIIKCLEKINVEVIDLVTGPLGDYYENKNNKTGESVGAIINIGGSKTEVSIFNKGILTATEIIEMGGNTLDADFGYIYKLNKKDAIYVKENLSLAHLSMAQANESMTFTNKNNDLVKINQYDASEISAARIAEILKIAKKHINHLTKKEISYIIVTGGMTELKDFNIILEQELGQIAKIGEVKEIGIRNNKFSTSAGLIKYYNSRLKLRNVEFSIFDLNEQEDLGEIHRKVNLSENSLLGKVFGYFFDN